MSAASHPLGFCSLSALDRPLAAAAELAASLGLDGIEVTARPPHLDPDAGPGPAREAARAVRDAGVEVLAYGSYLGHAGRATSDHARGEVEIARALRAPRLRVWAERIGDAPRNATLALLREACDAAAGHGIDVVVERHVGSFADAPERVEALLRDVDRENFALNYQVLDFLPPEQAAAQPEDAARLAPRARYFHLKNYRPAAEPDGPLQLGGALADGVLDQAKLLHAALDAGYLGPLVIEFTSFGPGALAGKLAADVDFVRGVLRERRAA